MGRDRRVARESRHPRHRPRGRPSFRAVRCRYARARGGGVSALLRLAGVTARRGGRTLFEGLDLVLQAGEAAVLTGPNGIGKSSLIRLAAGLLRADAGQVARAEAALADEHLALDERRRLGDALAFWVRRGGREQVAAGMAAMGLDHLAEVPVRMLSTGQRKRAALARVIASGAPLWLLDEPANGLDGEGQERLAAAMAAHRAAGGAVLAATHQPLGLDDARQVALG
ncbi:heme ABC exporter ATP-binding protein CcmA [Sphingosinicella ginsenosidimutans]|uniref:Heme ABC exporter ATP-binding protein CcmA n=1 Tax=Allosphingosinicella ginsenosidimutans TaxID=1176539 RepID=A0A5C6TTI1_9SPHN|nr:heme ABC exporter ATP-binding protein CcmA [Sphingosinicella ginsenosidimutans]